MNSKLKTQNSKLLQNGQALVEIALIFPLFLIVVFGVMQIGQLAAMTIVVNHAAFEVARIGAITAKLPEGGNQGVRCDNVQIDRARITRLARNIFERWPGKLVEPLQMHKSPTLKDPDPEVDRRNCDFDLSIQYQMPLVFPFVNQFLAQPPDGGYDPEVGMYRIITGQSRMPLEMPLW